MRTGKSFFIIALAIIFALAFTGCDSLTNGYNNGGGGGGVGGGGGNGGGGGGGGSGGGGGIGILTVTDLGAYNGKYAFATLSPMVSKDSFDMFACEEVLDPGSAWLPVGVLIANGEVSLKVWRRDKINAAWINYTESHDTMTVLIICNIPTPPYNAVSNTERIFYPLKFNNGSVKVSYTAGKITL